MRLATFNLESLDLPPKAKVPLEVRADVLRPALERLDADILCLQEVNSQRKPGHGRRSLLALDQLLAGTQYAHYPRVMTAGGKDHAMADVHNLVTLSRFPIRSHRELLHHLAPPLQYRLTTAVPPADDIQPIKFDRPILVTDIELPSGGLIAVVNVHLRAPLAVSVAGQKLKPFVWKSVGGWAEGYLLSAVRRAAQALEVRLLLEELFDADKHRLIAVVGDFRFASSLVPRRIPAIPNWPRAPSCCLIEVYREISVGAFCITAGRKCLTTLPSAAPCTRPSAPSRCTTRRLAMNWSAMPRTSKARPYITRRSSPNLLIWRTEATQPIAIVGPSQIRTPAGNDRRSDRVLRTDEPLLSRCVVWQMGPQTATDQRCPSLLGSFDKLKQLQILA